MNINPKEAILFSEVFYRKDKKFIEEETRKNKIFFVSFIFCGFLTFLTLLFMIKKPFDLTEILALLASIGFIIWSFWSYLSTLERILTYILIVPNGIKIIVSNKKLKGFISREEIKKIVINFRKKRIEIYLKDGGVIYSKRYDRRWMEGNFLSYEQFERFKKAMKEIGVEYELIYA